MLLIAGVGRRLAGDRPKVLLEVGGRTLLDRHLENLAALGIPVLAVTGWQAERIPVARQVVNPEYRRGSLLSLKAALSAVDEDVILMDGDVLYDPSILADVARLPRGFAIDPRTDPGDEEMMVGVKGGKVRAIRRGRLPGFEVVGEGVGFFKVDRASLPALRKAVEASDPDSDYEKALDRFVGEHGADYVLVAGRPWTEIDFEQDLERARRDILPRIAALGRGPRTA
ncbi:MAG: NTP transferase domain-containing protein [Planctomycetia bacterium]